MVIFIIVSAALVVNIALFQVFKNEVAGRARLTRVRKAKKGGAMYYLCPGILGRAKESFEFALPCILEDEGITLVDYVNTGVDPKSVARQIVTDVEANNYRPIIISISWGDMIARCLEGEIETTDIISINPCTSTADLKPKIDTLVSLLTPLAIIGSFLLGWLAYAPIIKAPGKKCSIALAVSQFATLWLAKEDEEIGTDTWGLILSSEDEILDNEWLEDKYQLPVNRVEYVETTHGNTIYQGCKYQEALDYLLTN